MMVMVCLIWAQPLWGETRELVIQEAVQEYHDGLNTTLKDQRLEHFRRAQRLFTQVIEEQGIVNADLYVNFGNAALQATDLGNAILAYRRALAVEPGHRRAKQNLMYARELLPDWIPRPKSRTLLDTFFFWHRTFSRGARWFGASLAFVMAAMLLAVAIRWRWSWARNLALLPAVVWLGLTGLPAWMSHPDDEAVITAVEVVARAADSTGAPARFAEALAGGTEVQIVEKRDSWVQIRLADSRDGWVRRSSLTPVSP
jgi:tetratricopeptide (TPR) repeat protein